MQTSNLQPPTSSLYGLIGYPLSHTFSPGYFQEKFRREGISAAYEAFPMPDIKALPALLKERPMLCGLNVTTPWKQEVIQYLDAISEDAEAIGAVNCIAIQDGRMTGHNTDWAGFRDSLTPLLQARHQKALVLGSGGASGAACYALRQMGIQYKIVSRSAAKGRLLYEAVTPGLLQEYLLLINTTTLGTLGKGLPPLPYEALGPEHLLYDLVYNPALTPFLAHGRERGAVIINGLKMLHLQAEASWKIWQREA